MESARFELAVTSTPRKHVSRLHHDPILLYIQTPILNTMAQELWEMSREEFIVRDLKGKKHAGHRNMVVGSIHTAMQYAEKFGLKVTDANIIGSYIKKKKAGKRPKDIDVMVLVENAKSIKGVEAVPPSSSDPTFALDIFITDGTNTYVGEEIWHPRIRFIPVNTTLPDFHYRHVSYAVNHRLVVPFKAVRPYPKLAKKAGYDWNAEMLKEKVQRDMAMFVKNEVVREIWLLRKGEYVIFTTEGPGEGDILRLLLAGNTVVLLSPFPGPVQDKILYLTRDQDDTLQEMSSRVLAKAQLLFRR